MALWQLVLQGSFLWAFNDTFDMSSRACNPVSAAGRVSMVTG